jgi:hypothetical protein
MGTFLQVSDFCGESWIIVAMILNWILNNLDDSLQVSMVLTGGVDTAVYICGFRGKRTISRRHIRLNHVQVPRGKLPLYQTSQRSLSLLSGCVNLA